MSLDALWILAIAGVVFIVGSILAAVVTARKKRYRITVGNLVLPFVFTMGVAAVAVAIFGFVLVFL